jgi:hypothetical protein
MCQTTLSHGTANLLFLRHGTNSSLLSGCCARPPPLVLFIDDFPALGCGKDTSLGLELSIFQLGDIFLTFLVLKLKQTCLRV